MGATIGAPMRAFFLRFLCRCRLMCHPLRWSTWGRWSAALPEP
jgi:hypothetical protein